MVELVRSDNTLKRYPQACPLSVYQSGTNRPGAVANCKTNPHQCKSGNRKACFDAAQVIEAGHSADDSLATYPLYMRACALGDGNACVNAGATIKNTDWSGPKPKQASTPQCQFRNFSKMCDEGHAWGCYMTALEYNRTGGYIGKSTAKYEQYMRRACKVSKTSGACSPKFN